MFKSLNLTVSVSNTFDSNRRFERLMCEVEFWEVFYGRCEGF
jgi:hypothetical protein